MRGKSLVRMKAPGIHSSGPRPKLHLGFAHNYVVPYLDRRTAVQVGCACRRVSQGITDYAQLLRVGIARRGVAVHEDDHQVAICLRRWVRALIEITGVRAPRRIKEIAEKAKRAGVAADPFRGRPRPSVVG